MEGERDAGEADPDAQEREETERQLAALAEGLLDGEPDGDDDDEDDGADIDREAADEAIIAALAA